MAKNTFTREEIVIFALTLLNKQHEDGLIDEEHLPPIDMDSASEERIKEVEAKIAKTGRIPHQNDILNVTRSFYTDDDSFTLYFTTLCARAEEDPELGATVH
jgi:hypothetical protein